MNGTGFGLWYDWLQGSLQPVIRLRVFAEKPRESVLCKVPFRLVFEALKESKLKFSLTDNYIYIYKGEYKGCLADGRTVEVAFYLDRYFVFLFRLYGFLLV